MAQTKQGLHLPLAHLSPQAVFTPSPAMIQNHGEKCTGVIHLLHMDVSSSATAISPALYHASDMMKGNRSRGIYHTH